MRVQGKGVSGGIAIGRLFYLDGMRELLPQYAVADSEAEMQRFLTAKELAAERLNQLCQKALIRVGREQSLIFEFHQMMLEDHKFLGIVEDIIRNQHLNAEYAVNEAARQVSALFHNMDDPYFQARSDDVYDSARTLLDALTGSAPRLMAAAEPVILAAQELMPSETLQLEKENLLGFVINEGSVDSHTSILARTMGIPAVIHLPHLLKNHNGELVIVDGSTGQVIFSPDAQTLRHYQRMQEDYHRYQQLLHTQIGLENVTKDGRRISLLANIGSAEDVAAVLDNDAAGIGLFRSEFIYLGRGSAPEEEEQFAIYRQVVQAMGGKRVVIRTLDIGADKRVAYFPDYQEENPAMGYRAIRICLKEQELFVTQLRAIYRASAFGRVSIMFPMIVSLEEVLAVKALTEQVKQSLRAQGLPFSDQVELGIMIETPAAAMISDLLAKEVDFFSVGTNDLVQYTLAADRLNPKVEEICNSHHPAILRLIRIAADAIHREGKRIGICGEMAADPQMTRAFLEMGIDELSMAPSMILEIRRHLRSLDLSCDEGREQAKRISVGPVPV